MKILHLVTSVFNAGGGTSEVIPKMCEALANSGQQVRLLTGAFGKPAESAIHAANNGVDVRYRELVKYPIVGWGMSGRFKEELVSGVKWADIIHIHGHWQILNWVAPRVARQYFKPYVMQPHGFLEPERLKKSKWQKKIVGAVFERKNLNRAACVIATAESERRAIEAFGVSAPISVVPLGMDVVQFDKGKYNRDLLRRLDVDVRKKTLLYFSRIAPIKGLDMLADAWMRLESFHGEWQLLIVGPGDEVYVNEIKSLFQSKIKDGSTIFAEPLYGQDKLDLLKSVDAFVLPTRSENFGIAVQEALASGLPVVCTKGAPWPLLESAGAGFWVGISVDAIAEGLTNLFSMNVFDRATLSRNGRRLIETNFSWEIETKKLLKVYDESSFKYRDMTNDG